ncbi:MAG: hypothetical protein LBF32_01075 [Streptococcaceae bacterium]|jgi:uncharacterized Zn finger protein|nr:hypothetical protein [Streptococcaceae bacterium]
MWGYYDYVPVSEKKKRAQKKLKKLQKKNPDIKPVIVEGRAIAKTFWGISWNKNLASYADYSNRIGRGRSYVKNGLILDLQIKECEVSGLVYGSSGEVYSVNIEIAKFPEKKWKKILKSCSHQIESMEKLISGVFPKELKESFLQKGEGLFPNSDEIVMSCDCYDYATMCKHVSAILYGVGARLDSEPMLFFTLRGIDSKELLAKTVEEKIQDMIKNSDRKTSRMMDEDDISELFRIE